MVYKWYIPPIGGLYGTYHLLMEPGNSIESTPSLLKCICSHMFMTRKYLMPRQDCGMFWVHGILDPEIK